MTTDSREWVGPVSLWPVSRGASEILLQLWQLSKPWPPLCEVGTTTQTCKVVTRLNHTHPVHPLDVREPRPLPWPPVSSLCLSLSRALWGSPKQTLHSSLPPLDFPAPIPHFLLGMPQAQAPTCALVFQISGLYLGQPAVTSCA